MLHNTKRPEHETSNFSTTMNTNQKLQATLVRKQRPKICAPGRVPQWTLMPTVEVSNNATLTDTHFTLSL